jgi:hypothetical protein
MNNTIKNRVRSIARQRFNIPKGVYISVFDLGDSQYKIHYSTEAEHTISVCDN